jgi:hypothetical protein
VVTLVDRLTGSAERLAIQTTRARPGAERTLCASRRFDVAVSAPPANALQDLEDAGVRVIGLKRTSARQVWAWWPLYRLLREERIDVLHSHKFGSNLWGTVIGRMARVPVIVAHEHTWSYEGKPWRRIADREVIARGSSAFIAVSREDLRRMIEIEGIDRRRDVHPQRDPYAASAQRRRRARRARDRADALAIGTVSVLRPRRRSTCCCAHPRAGRGFRPEGPDRGEGTGASRSRT